MTRAVLVFGATSAIARALSRRLARRGDALLLVGRDRRRLQVLADDLALRGASRVAVHVLDARDHESHAGLVPRACEALGGLDVAVIAHGTLPEQDACERDAALAREAFDVNALGVISLLTHLANHFEAQGRGSIAVVTSVAGLRGRGSNYVYGAAKGAVNVFLQGLRNRLHGAGVRVLTVMPGFVDTPMTAHLRKGALWASPERVAGDIERGLERGADVLYTPWFWRYLMLILRCIPESVFKRLRL